MKNKTEKPKTSVYTLGKLKKFLSTLTKEQLKQPVHIAFEDCAIQDLDGHEITKEDIYMNDYDSDDLGTLKEFESIHGDNLMRKSLEIVTKKGTVIFY